jgi:LL-diaminopimelate aminotransferase
MKLKLSKRMENFQPLIFNELAEYKNMKLSQGLDLIDLSIGSPDMPPPEFVIEALASKASKQDQYGYSLTGTKEFYEAAAEYYELNFGVSLNPEKEVLLLMGSQDGIVHLPMVFADPGDLILVPDPGYTAYATGIAMAGAKTYFMPLKKENHFLPDVTKIPEYVANQAKIMILNFPGNPVPCMANEAFFKEVIDFAKKYNIIVVHDFAYCELYYDGKKPISFLSVPGAKDVGVEFNSLSKSFNMAGCRIGFISGNEEIIQAFKQFKSNLDYGIFYPIQYAASMALRKGAAFLEHNRSIYQRRRDMFVDGLASIGWNVEKPAGGMFVWAEVPKGWSSTDFTIELIERAHVVVTPGNAFGPTGEGFVRIALVQSEEKLKKAISNLSQCGLFNYETV